MSGHATQKPSPTDRLETPNPRVGQTTPIYGQRPLGTVAPKPVEQPEKSRAARPRELDPKNRNSSAPRAPARWIGYVRVSTREQAVEGLSLESQRKKINHYAGSNDLTLEAVHEDAGASGKSIDRPGLTAALDALRSGQADGLVVVKLDRLTRSTRDLDRLITDLFGPTGRKGNPAGLVSLSESLNTLNATGRFFVLIIGLIAQWERETIVERTQDAIDHKRARGERIGTIPYGWRIDPDGKSLAVDADEQAVIDELHAARQRGRSFQTLANDLNAAGVPTKSGRTWRASTLAKILRRDSRAPDHAAQTLPH